MTIPLLSNNSGKQRENSGGTAGGNSGEQQGTAGREAVAAPSRGSIKCGHVKERDGIDVGFCPAPPFYNLFDD
ncbi:hypothetical protein ABC974_02425 [Sphingomonas oligophenolica]|uniref:Uncharacterized protein n=1 Tax=Sphingomonas oligophenolica TaxID=301154 RepID=A0ABU9XY67_9SPHN